MNGSRRFSDRIAMVLARAAVVLACLGIGAGAARAELLYVSLSDSTIVTYDVSLPDQAAVLNSRTVFANSTGLSAPEEMVFDAAGNLYTANRNGNSITRITPAGVKSTFASGTASLINKPIGLAIDRTGNLYVANENGGTITKLTPEGTASTFGTGLSLPYGLAADAAGSIYVSNRGNSTIVRFTSLGVSSTFASTNLNDPRGLAFNAAGDLFAANVASQTIGRFTPAGVGSTFPTLSGSPGPNDVAFDSLGNIYVAGNGNRTVQKYDSAGVFQFSWSVGGPRAQFLAVEPVPEPSTWVLAVLGGGLLAWRARSRQRRA